MARRVSRFLAAAGALALAAGCQGEVTSAPVSDAGLPDASPDSGPPDGGTVVMPPLHGPFGDGGYAFAIADGDAPSPYCDADAGRSPSGPSHATIASDGTLCMSGEVGVIPPTTFLNDCTTPWGVILGINLNQAMGASTPANAYTLTGTGVTVDVNFVPPCTTARVLLDQDGATPPYCAALTPGVEIPWAAFSTECWNPGGGVALTGPPSSQSIRILFVSGTEGACPFTDFCLTGLQL